LAAAWPWRSSNSPVLLHGDYWPGNLLWNAGRLVAVVDWEEPRIGDPLVDVAISRLDLLWMLGADAMHAFTRAYIAITNVDVACLPYWDLCAALRPASNLPAWAGSWPDLGRPDISEATMRAGHRQFVDRAFDALRG
jgi:aminoglycoside phosphotransferase (APT) family kinase protein